MEKKLQNVETSIAFKRDMECYALKLELLKLPKSMTKLLNKNTIYTSPMILQKSVLQFLFKI